MKKSISIFFLFAILAFCRNLTAETDVIDHSKHIRWGSKDSPLDGLTITWRGLGASDKIKWGYTNSFERGEFSTISRKGYTDFFSDYTFPTVKSNSILYYQIYDSDTGGYGTTKTFKTAPASSGEPYSIIAMGDSRTYVSDWQKVANAANIHDAAAVLFVGDIVNTGGSNSDWDGWFDHGVNVIKDKLFYHTLGNHEIRKGGTTKYLNNFVMPEAKTGTELYYSFEYGDAIFINLNSEVPEDSTQFVWLQSTLEANQDKTWKIVWFHCPFYTTGSHADEMNDFFNTWWKAFDDYGVDLIFNGHDHMYQRTKPINRNISTTTPVVEYGSEPGKGRCQIVTGGAGAPLYDVGSAWWLEAGASKLHYCKLDFIDNDLKVKVFDESQVVIDQFILSK